MADLVRRRGRAALRTSPTRIGRRCRVPLADVRVHRRFALIQAAADAAAKVAPVDERTGRRNGGNGCAGAVRREATASVRSNRCLLSELHS